MRIEELIRRNPIKTDRGDFLEGSEFILRVSDQTINGELHVYVHPSGRNGDTEDYIVRDNMLIPLNYADQMNPPIKD